MNLAAGRLYLSHNAGGVLGAHFLQPADVDVLQQWVGNRVGGGGAGGAVPADHDAIKRAALDDGVADTGLEVGEFGPLIQFGVADVGVEVGLGREVAAFVQRAEVPGLAVLGVGVGGTGHRAGNAEANLVTCLVTHRGDIDLRQEVAGFLNAAFELLGDGRLHGEFGGDVVDAVEGGQLLQVGVEELTGIVAHGVTPVSLAGACPLLISSR